VERFSSSILSRALRSLSFGDVAAPGAPSLQRWAAESLVVQDAGTLTWCRTCGR